MPIYEFECKDCIDSRITVSWNINDNIPTYTCQTCGHTMVRVYSAPAITFKGNGWGKDNR